MSSIGDIRANAPRILGLNSFDLIGTAIIAIPVAKYIEQPYPLALAEMLLLGEAVHLAMGIDTPITLWLSN